MMSAAEREATRVMVAGLPWEDVGMLLGLVIGRMTTEVGPDDARALVAVSVDAVLIGEAVAVAAAMRAKT